MLIYSRKKALLCFLAISGCLWKVPFFILGDWAWVQIPPPRPEKSITYRSTVYPKTQLGTSWVHVHSAFRRRLPTAAAMRHQVLHCRPLDLTLVRTGAGGSNAANVIAGTLV